MSEELSIYENWKYNNGGEQPKDTYQHEYDCGNCGVHNSVFIKKGVLVHRAMIECFNCGCKK